MTINIAVNETKKRAAEKLRQIADLIENGGMALSSIGFTPESPRPFARVVDTYKVRIDLEFWIVSQRCSQFVDETWIGLRDQSQYWNS